MDRTTRARIARIALLVAACGDPPDPGAGDETTGTSSTAVDPPTTADHPTSDGDGDGTGGATTSGDDATTEAPVGCPAPVVAERGFFFAGATDIALTPCGQDRWYFAGASESTLEVSITRKSGARVTAVVAYPDEPDVWSDALLGPFTSDAATTSVVFPVPRSGEFALHVDTDQGDDVAATYDLGVRCILGCERETTRFPIVLVHGWTGWDAIGPLTYFYNVADDLMSLGYPVHVVQLDPYNSSNVRAGQLADQLGDALPLFHARKVDLLGHSQGGVDSRAAISTYGYGDRVSALITIASPHRGTFIADAALGLAPGPVEDVAGLLLNFLGAVTAQEKSDALASFASLSEAYMVGTFNPANPDDERVQYISYTGRTCSALDFLDAGLDCQDLVDPLIGWSFAILEQFRGPNDGLVTVDSAQWGEYRGEMIADHIDEVGQILGVTDPKFDHLGFYRARARDLADEMH